jgi:RNA polymerase sigma-70 factor (ECF subfamily)
MVPDRPSSFDFAVAASEQPASSQHNSQTGHSELTFQEELNQLYRRHYPRLCRLAGTFLSSPADAEDAVQNVFLRLISGGERSLPIEPSYLSRAVANAARDILRKRKRSRRTIENLRTEFKVRSLPDAPEGRDSQPADRLAVALDSLSPGQRTVLVRVCLEGTERREVAQDLGITPASVNQQLWRAKKRLRASLEDQNR